MSNSKHHTLQGNKSCYLVITKIKGTLDWMMRCSRKKKKTKNSASVIVMELHCYITGIGEAPTCHQPCSVYYDLGIS